MLQQKHNTKFFTSFKYNLFVLVPQEHFPFENTMMAKNKNKNKNFRLYLMFSLG